LQMFENARAFADSAAQKLVSDKLGKAAFDCVKSSAGYRKIRDAAIEFLNSSLLVASNFADIQADNEASPVKESTTTNSGGFTDVNLLAALIEDDDVESSISYEEKLKKFTALANLLAQMEKVNRGKFIEILANRLEREESISTNLNNALVALIALDVYLDSKSATSEEDVIVLRKIAPSISVVSRQMAKGHKSKSTDRGDADLNVLFVSSALKFLKNAAEKDSQNLAANILAAMFAIAIETLGASSKRMVLNASRLSNAAVREQPLAARGAVSGMISSTRVKFKALLDYSSGIVDDVDGDDEGGGASEDKKLGKISLRTFQ